MIYIRKFKSGKIAVFLRPCQLITGKFMIETWLYDKNEWELNINLPLFKSRNAAEKWLQKNYELLQ